MKRNSQLILLSLFTASNSDAIFLSEPTLYTLFPSITLSGLRSLLFRLRQKQLIAIQNMGTTRQYFLTDKGRSWCRDLFPALTRGAGTGEWLLLIFVKAPRTDAHFHYLRSLCKSSQAIALTRGVYAFSEKIPSQIAHVCQQLYDGHVIIARVQSFASGFDWNTINDSIGLWDKYSSYSSISKQTSELLRKFNVANSLTTSEKKSIQSLVIRFFSILTEDPGLVPPNVPEENLPVSILSRLQKLLLL